MGESIASERVPVSRGRAAYRISFARGILALSLGAAMLVQPEKATQNLATYMGVFWTLTGVVSIRSALAGERTRGVPLISGLAESWQARRPSSADVSTRWPPSHCSSMCSRP
jgi:hypothetical protein